MIESITSAVPAPIFKETFNDEFTTRQNDGIPTGISFDSGEGVFNGSTSNINYDLALNGIYSIRIKCKHTSLAAYATLFDCRGSVGNGSGYIQLNVTTGNSAPSNGTSYVNGVQTVTTLVGINMEIVVTGITLKQGTGVNKSLIGSHYANISQWLGTIGLLEIYLGTLSASEVSNLYNNRRNVPLSPTTTKYPILDVSARRGLIENRLTGSTINGNLVPAVVVTDVAVRSKKMYGNGLTSSINVGTYSTFVSDISLVFFGRLNNYGEGGVGRIFDNGKFKVYVTSTNNRIAITSDGSTVVYSATNSIIAGVDYCIVARRKADGKATVWVGTMKSPMALSGTADQASGTPAVGTTAITILNDATGVYTFDGSMGWCYCVNGILSDVETEELRTSNARLL